MRWQIAMAHLLLDAELIRIIFKFPLKKVSPIQAIPKIATTAVAPALKTLPDTMLSTFGLQKIIIRAAIVNITISIVFGMERRANFPSTIHPGRSASNEPRSTTRKVPTKKRITDNLAPFTPTNSFSLQS